MFVESVIGSVQCMLVSLGTEWTNDPIGNTNPGLCPLLLQGLCKVGTQYEPWLARSFNGTDASRRGVFLGVTT